MVNVRVVPLTVQLVGVSKDGFVSGKTSLSTVIKIVSVVELRFVKVNTVVEPSPMKFSSSISSRINLKDSKCVCDPSSIIIVSVVIVESSSVPVSCKIPPPTILTNPDADTASVSALAAVNVRVSPTSYSDPTSSTSTPSTEPSSIPETTADANPLPTLSTVISSASVWSIPSLTTAPLDKTDVIVNLISTSLVFEVADIISPEVKVPLMFDISNSVIDAVPS